MRRRVTYAVVLVLACASGCGSRRDTGAERAGPADGRPGSMAAALEAWRSFPVGADPRPIVVIGPGVRAPEAGFPDSDTKQAWLAGAIDLPGKLPAAPTRAAGYPLLTAAEAGRHLGEGGHDASATRLVVTGARLGTRTVATDRGPRPLPVWLFTLRRVPGEASVLAVAPPARFLPGPATGDAANPEPVTLHPDGTLTVRFVGAAAEPGPCGADYAVDVTETATAVGLAIRTVPRRADADPGAGCDAVGYSREVRVRLAAPLGARVVVGPGGLPAQVTTGR